MDNFPFALGFVLGFCAIAAVCIISFGLGKEDLRGRYHQCIMLEAPQENCIKQYLGDK